MSAIAIIPARGGSKRIPRKNIKPFHGQPMIGHSITAALESGLFARVVVSTDDDEIAEVAQACGAEVPFLRPAELASDHAGTVPVVQHALEALAVDVEFVCCLYAAAPFASATRLREGLALLRARPDMAFVFTVTEFASPIQRALRLTATGGVESLYPEYRQTRTQDLAPAYHDAGQFYWGRRELWRAGAALHAAHSLPLVLPRREVVDIDTPEDWALAERLYGELHGRKC